MERTSNFFLILNLMKLDLPQSLSTALDVGVVLMDASQRPKQAACLICRKGKIKCEFLSGESTRCKRCQQLDAECVRPIIHAGRQKGIKK